MSVSYSLTKHIKKTILPLGPWRRGVVIPLRSAFQRSGIDSHLGELVSHDGETS